ncbi:hypothetical protein BH23GEM11_BH23GEM11_14830 [soil metagenome]
MSLVSAASPGTDQVPISDLFADLDLFDGRVEAAITSLSHTAHHRGQLTVYYRMLGVPVPGLYGPTADDGRG